MDKEDEDILQMKEDPKKPRKIRRF